MTVQLEKDWTSMACLEGLAGESFFSLKATWRHGLGLQSCIWTNHKTSGTMSFGQTRTKWRCLAIMHSATVAMFKVQRRKRREPANVQQTLITKLTNNKTKVKRQPFTDDCHIKHTTEIVQNWSSLILHCRYSSFYPSELLCENHSIPTALGWLIYRYLALWDCIYQWSTDILARLINKAIFWDYIYHRDWTIYTSHILNGRYLPFWDYIYRWSTNISSDIVLYLS